MPTVRSSSHEPFRKAPAQYEGTHVSVRNTVEWTAYDLLAVSLLGFLEFRLIMFMHQHNLAEIVNETYNVLIGRAYWRAFQSKLLAPYLIRMLSDISGSSYRSAFQVFCLVALVGTNILAYWMFRRLTHNRLRALGYVCAFSGLFVALQDGQWIYAWDFIDVVVFLLLSYLLFTRRAWWAYALLFPAAVLNRETGLFIPAAMILVAAVDPDRQQPRRRIAMLAAGVILLILGVLYIKLTRDLLFESSWHRYVGWDLNNQALGNHIEPGRNLRAFVENITQCRLDIVANLFLAGSGVFLYLRRRSFDRPALVVLSIFAGVIASVFLFGLLTETRHLLVLIPMILMLHWYLSPEALREARVVPVAGSR